MEISLKLSSSYFVFLFQFIYLQNLFFLKGPSPPHIFLSQAILPDLFEKIIPHPFHCSLSHSLSSLENQFHLNHHHGEVVVCYWPCVHACGSKGSWPHSKPCCQQSAPKKKKKKDLSQNEGLQLHLWTTLSTLFPSL